MKYKHHPLIVCCLSSFIFGCASTKEDVFKDAEKEMKTMGEIYESAMVSDKSSQLLIKREINDGEEDLSGYARNESNVLSMKFPRLNNPTLYMYVYPHITSSNNPIPGYITHFKMFKEAPYVLPHENK